MEDQYSRPARGIEFLDLGASILVAIIIGVGSAFAGAVFVYGWDEARDAESTAAHVAETTARRALPPSEIVYWHRHERNSRECRGQAYVWSCCDHERDSGDLTCLHPERK